MRLASGGEEHVCTPFTCFTGTKVHILTGTKAQMPQAFAVRLASGGEEHVVVVCEDGAGTQFACFTGTKVRILTERSLWTALVLSLLDLLVQKYQFICFPGTKVRILTERSMWTAAGTEFTCFTGTKVQILALQAPCGCGV